MMQTVFQIADNYEPLSKKDQHEKWLRVIEARETLKKFDHSQGKSKNYSYPDKDFKYWNQGLIADFKKAHPVGMLDRRKVDIGLEAYNTLIYTNMRMIISIAKIHANNSVSLDTLIQAGTQGAMKAIMKFKPDNSEKRNQPRQMTLGIIDGRLEQEELEEIPHYSYKVSSYMRFWISCYVIQEFKKVSELIKSNPTSSSAGQRVLSLDESDGRASQDCFDEYPEIDFYALIRMRPTELECLECTDLELAGLKGITIDEAHELKREIASELRKYLAV